MCPPFYTRLHRALRTAAAGAKMIHQVTPLSPASRCFRRQETLPPLNGVLLLANVPVGMVGHR